LSAIGPQLLDGLVQVGRILRSRAGTFVVIGWLLFVVSIPICLSIIVTTSISLTYFAASPHVPFDAYDNSACCIFLASVAFAAVASSIALALKFRVTCGRIVGCDLEYQHFRYPDCSFFCKGRAGLFRAARRPRSLFVAVEVRAD
jgi:hypothetical protein